MKKYLLSLATILLSFSISSFSNDGIINSYGGNLICAKETVIELRKEILSFTKIGNEMFVEIYFEFFNPENERKEQVGFFSPPTFRPDADKDKAHPNIKEFTVTVNGEQLSYKVSPIQETEFKSVYERIPRESFVYYFETTFKKGLNVIKHSYKFSPSFSTGGVSGTTTYDYKLTTGKNWANSVIVDFELKIKMNGIFTVPFNFQREADNNWKLIGDGKISDYDGIKVHRKKLLYANIKNGYLIYKCKNLQPYYNITIQYYNPLDYVEPIKTIFWSSMNRGHGLEKLTSEDYRIARNTIFAIKGYKFKSSDLNDYFNKYFWYIPDDNVKNSMDILDTREKKLFDRTVELEKAAKQEEKTNRN